MIEKLKNCPNCAGILDEVGRCNYCGSKVYDFLTLDFDGYRSNGKTAKTYIRVRSCGKVKLIPVAYVVGASFKIEPQFDSFIDTCNYEYRVSRPPYMEMDLTLVCHGDIITYEDGDSE